MSTYADNGRAYSSEEIVQDPEGYMQNARQTQKRAAYTYVAGEIARRATAYQRTKVDTLARLVINLAVIGIGLSSAVFVVGYIFTR